MKRLLVLLVVLFVAGTAAAQPAAKGSNADAKQDRREKIKQKIRALRAYTLTEQLNLDEATAAKLFPALAKYDDEFDKLLQQRADLQKQLNAADQQKDAKAVDKLIDDAVANQKALWDTEAKRLEQLRKILTPQQVAKVLVVLPAMERKIQNQLRKAIQGGGGKRGRKAGPDDDIEAPDFDKNDGDLKDPFADAPRKQGKKQKKQQGDDELLCSPFDTAHGCKKSK